MADEIPEFCPQCHSKLSSDPLEVRDQGDEEEAEEDSDIGTGDRPIPRWSEDPILTPGGLSGETFIGNTIALDRIFREIQTLRIQQENELDFSDEEKTVFSDYRTDISDLTITNRHLVELRVSTEKILNEVGFTLSEYFQLDDAGEINTEFDTAEDWTDVERGRTTAMHSGEFEELGNDLVDTDEFTLPDDTTTELPSLPLFTTIRGIHLEELRRQIPLAIDRLFISSSMIIETPPASDEQWRSSDYQVREFSRIPADLDMLEKTFSNTLQNNTFSSHLNRLGPQRLKLSHLLSSTIRTIKAKDGNLLGLFSGSSIVDITTDKRNLWTLENPETTLFIVVKRDLRTLGEISSFQFNMPQRSDISPTSDSQPTFNIRGFAVDENNIYVVGPSQTEVFNVSGLKYYRSAIYKFNKETGDQENYVEDIGPDPAEEHLQINETILSDHSYQAFASGLAVDNGYLYLQVGKIHTRGKNGLYSGDFFFSFGSPTAPSAVEDREETVFPFASKDSSANGTLHTNHSRLNTSSDNGTLQHTEFPENSLIKVDKQTLLVVSSVDLPILTHTQRHIKISQLDREEITTDFYAGEVVPRVSIAVGLEEALDDNEQQVTPPLLYVFNELTTDLTVAHEDTNPGGSTRYLILSEDVPAIPVLSIRDRDTLEIIEQQTSFVFEDGNRIISRYGHPAIATSEALKHT